VLIYAGGRGIKLGFSPAAFNQLAAPAFVALPHTVFEVCVVTPEVVLPRAEKNFDRLGFLAMRQLWTTLERPPASYAGGRKAWLPDWTTL
jgi:hypothetical protein